jgi:hypothetical protein
LVTKGQLDFVKSKIDAGAEPWLSARDKILRDDPQDPPFLASPTYAPKPRESVNCGSNSVPDEGCTDEKNDAKAAYTHALLWALTGDEAYAHKAIEIMNAWSAVLKTHTLSNRLVESGWAGAVFVRASEIMRHTYDGWPQAEVDRFATMLMTAYLPFTMAGTTEPFGMKSLVPNGNWEAVMIEASIGIAVFTDDRPTFDKAIDMWKARVPAYIYMTSDGEVPSSPPGIPPYDTPHLVDYWGITNWATGQPSPFQADGIGQETCRDFHHLEYGFAGLINAAETALIQGVDLYVLEKTRLAAGFEFNMQFLDGVSPPPWLCGHALDTKCGHGWEVGYNELANRLGMSLPHSKNFIAKIRPTDADHHMVWETLTHADVGSAGL